MAYSNWLDSFWHTAPITGADFIDGSKLFINPRKGDGQTFTYAELKALDLNTDWVARTFPDALDIWLSELLRFIHIYMDDMENNVYRYQGFKIPTAGDANEKRDSERFVIDRRSDSAA